MATVVTFSWERALRRLLLEVLLWLGVVVETVGWVVLGWWVRLYSPDGGEGCLASHSGSGGALHLASGRTIDGSTLVFGGRWDPTDEEMSVLPPIIVTSQPLC